MVSPLSTFLGEIFIENLETQFLVIKVPLAKRVIFFCRYVDDVFCLFKDQSREIDQFLTTLYSFYKKIQFTMELESNNRLNFLKLRITKNENHLELNLPTLTDIITDSNQSYCIKMITFHSLLYRLLLLPIRAVTYSRELKTIKAIAPNKGYNTVIINKLINKK